MKIVLASKSPRRIELLSRYIEGFEILPSQIDENLGAEASPEIDVMTLAFEKAWDAAKRTDESSLVIGSDTVVAGEEILGKPKDREDAFRMLKSLSGKEHRVITGIALINLEKNLKAVDYEESKVVFRELTDSMIENYLDTGEYEDKAGSYAIQGIGEILCERFEGSFSNIVGLPLVKLDEMMKKHTEKGLI